MKRFCSISTIIVFAFVVFGFGQAYGGIYKPGVYTASAKGKSKKVPIKVEVKVTDSKIESVKVLSHKESIKLVKSKSEKSKKIGEAVVASLVDVPANIVKSNSICVDAVAKATITTNAIKLAVAKALDQAIVK